MGTASSIRDEWPDLAAWVEERTAGDIIRAERQGRWRVHWMLDVETSDGELALLARMPRDPAYVRLLEFTSHYDTAYEARVLAALQPTNIPTPRLHGFHEPTETLLIDRLTGSGDVRQLSPDRGAEVLDDYIEHLVAIHELPLSTFDGLAAGPPDPTRPAGQLQWIRRDYEKARPGIRPEPLLDFALAWLDGNLPADHARRSIVQGDTGPGQFMFDDTGLVGLIDWELADIDHPMLDLGVMRMRNVLYPVGPLDRALGRYEELSARPLDVEAVRYFTVVASLVSLLGMAPSMQQPSAAIDSMLPRLAWDVSMRRCLCEALLEANHIEPAPPDLPDPVATARRGASLHEFLVEHLETTCAGLARDDYDQYLLGGAVGLAKTLRRLDAIEDELDEANLDDLELVLGTRPIDLLDADAILDQKLAAGSEVDVPTLLRTWHRIAVRREFAWAPLMVAQGSGMLVPLAEA